MSVGINVMKGFDEREQIPCISHVCRGSQFHRDSLGTVMDVASALRLEAIAVVAAIRCDL